MMYYSWIFLFSFLCKNIIINGHAQKVHLKESLEEDGLSHSFIPQKSISTKYKINRFLEMTPTLKPWSVGKATLDTTSNNAFCSALCVNHTIGEGPNNAVAYVYKYGCEVPRDDALITVFDQKYEEQNNRILYNIAINKTLVNNSSMVVFDAGYGTSKGQIKFCTKVFSVLDGDLGSANVSFTNTNIVLSFDISDSDLGAPDDDEKDPGNDDGLSFSISSASISGSPGVEIDIESNVYSVKACQCTRESFDCLDPDSVPVISQDENIAICLETSSNEVKVSNFYLRMTSGDQALIYEPVTMGNGQWSVNAESLTTVVNQGNKVRIETFAVKGLFDNSDDENKVVVSGSAYLEFASTKKNVAQTNGKNNLVTFGLTLELEDEDNGKGSGGCIGNIINTVISSMFG